MLAQRAVRIVLPEQPLVWLGAQSGSAFQDTTLPLALLREGNLYRDYALAALRCRPSLAHRLRVGKHRWDGSHGARGRRGHRARGKVAGRRRLGERDDMPSLPSATSCSGSGRSACFPRPIIWPPIERHIGPTH
jgi:hypothetical protein